MLAGRTPTFDDLPSLPRTRAVVAETIRLYPPAWIMGRSLADDLDDVGGWRIPAGSIVLALPWVLHRDATVLVGSTGVPTGALARRRRAFRRDGPGSAAGGLVPVRLRVASVHRRPVRLDRGGPRPCHPCSPVRGDDGSGAWRGCPPRRHAQTGRGDADGPSPSSAGVVRAPGKRGQRTVGAVRLALAVGAPGAGLRWWCLAVRARAFAGTSVRASARRLSREPRP